MAFQLRFQLLDLRFHSGKLFGHGRRDFRIGRCRSSGGGFAGCVSVVRRGYRIVQRGDWSRGICWRRGLRVATRSLGKHQAQEKQGRPRRNGNCLAQGSSHIVRVLPFFTGSEVRSMSCPDRLGSHYCLYGSRFTSPSHLKTHKERVKGS